MNKQHPLNALATLRQKIQPLNQQADIQNGWLKQRLETVVPEVMKRERFYMWIVA